MCGDCVYTCVHGRVYVGGLSVYVDRVYLCTCKCVYGWIVCGLCLYMCMCAGGLSVCGLCVYVHAGVCMWTD